MSKYFTIDEYGGFSDEFDTLEEALDAARSCISEYNNDDEWPQEVLDGSIKVGKILFESGMTNQRKTDDDSEIDFYCDCEMIEVEEQPSEG